MRFIFSSQRKSFETCAMQICGRYIFNNKCIRERVIYAFKAHTSTNTHAHTSVPERVSNRFEKCVRDVGGFLFWFDVFSNSPPPLRILFSYIEKDSPSQRRRRWMNYSG